MSVAYFTKHVKKRRKAKKLKQKFPNTEWIITLKISERKDDIRKKPKAKHKSKQALEDASNHVYTLEHTIPFRRYARVKRKNCGLQCHLLQAFQLLRRPMS